MLVACWLSEGPLTNLSNQPERKKFKKYEISFLCWTYRRDDGEQLWSADIKCRFQKLLWFLFFSEYNSLCINYNRLFLFYKTLFIANVLWSFLDPRWHWRYWAGNNFHFLKFETLTDFYFRSLWSRLTCICLRGKCRNKINSSKSNVIFIYKISPMMNILTIYIRKMYC